MASMVSVDVPPADTSGSWMPVTGRRPTTYPMLMIACAVINTVIVEVISLRKGSSDRRAIRIPMSIRPTNNAMTTKAPMSPSSSPTIAKMKSLCAFGR